MVSERGNTEKRYSSILGSEIPGFYVQVDGMGVLSANPLDVTFWEDSTKIGITNHCTSFYGLIKPTLNVAVQEKIQSVNQ